MKKIILLLLTVVSFSTAYGQSKWHEKQNNYFVEKAAKEYDLTAIQKEDLRSNRMKMVMAFVNSTTRYKAGDISLEKRKEITKEASREFNSYFSKLVGQNYKQVAPFLKRMRGELKNLK